MKSSYGSDVRNKWKELFRYRMMVWCKLKNIEEFGEEEIKYFLDNNMVQHRYLDITEALYNSIKTEVKEKED